MRRLLSTSMAVLVPLIPATTLLVPSTVLSPLEIVENEDILISSASSKIDCIFNGGRLARAATEGDGEPTMGLLAPAEGCKLGRCLGVSALSPEMWFPLICL